MRLIIHFTIILTFHLAAFVNLYSQNITHTLGTNGVFKLKDNTYDYLTVTQTNGQINILKTLRLENTDNYLTGVVYKGENRFLHSYGSDNIFLGSQSGNFFLTGMRNSAIGAFTLFSNTAGNDNSAFGYGTLYLNTTGSFNSAFGSQTLYLNTTGNYNSVFGHNVLLSNTTGSYNSAFGTTSLFWNTTGNHNSALGYNALLFNTTGSFNSAFGTNSLGKNNNGQGNSAYGMHSLNSNTSGNNNTAVGYFALFNNTTGNNNIAIGYGSNVPSGTSSNQVRIGNSSVSYAGIQVAWTITSDIRWKENISGLNLGLGFISRLRPVSYTRINTESNKTEYGLIAQEVEQVLKEEGVDNSGMLTITEDGMYELRYNDLLAPMIKSIQELKSENDKLNSENNLLKDRISKLEVLQTVILNQLEKFKSEEDQVRNIHAEN